MHIRKKHVTFSISSKVQYAAKIKKISNDNDHDIDDNEDSKNKIQLKQKSKLR